MYVNGYNFGSSLFNRRGEVFVNKYGNTIVYVLESTSFISLTSCTGAHPSNDIPSDKCVAKASLMKVDPAVVSSSSMPSLHAISSRSGEVTGRSLDPDDVGEDRVQDAGQRISDLPAPILTEQRSVTTLQMSSDGKMKVGERLVNWSSNSMVRSDVAKNRRQSDERGSTVGVPNSAVLSSSIDSRKETELGGHRLKYFSSSSFGPAVHSSNYSSRFVSELARESARSKYAKPPIVLRSLVSEERIKSATLGLKGNLDSRRRFQSQNAEK